MKQVLNLKEQGVDTVFGYPGGAILNIYDELYKQSDKIHHVLTSHEQGASHAADGYARATGKVGVCMATSGPGATNLVTGLATAYMDSIPVVAITANVGVSLLGKDSFQEIDIKGVTMPVTKHNYIVKDIEKLADTIREAFQIAQSGRKGPVLVDITKDVTMKALERFLRPEFLGRIDEIVIFKNLSFDTFQKIAVLMLDELVPSLKDKGIELVYDDTVPVFLAKQAYGSKKNARGLRDAVRRNVEEKLANAIVFNQDIEIKKISLTADDDLKIQIN